MSKSEELLKSDRLVKDLEIKLHTAQIALDKNQEEFATLVVLQSHLENNIKVLKKTGIVSIASEYKKAKEDLQKTRNRLNFLRYDISVLCKAHKQLKEALEHAKECYKKLSSISENNVIRAHFGRKNGQK